MVKLTCRGRDFASAVRRHVGQWPSFASAGHDQHGLPAGGAGRFRFHCGRATTSFVDERPQLLTAHSSADRGSKILSYLADVTVNQPHGPRTSTVYPHDKLPAIDLSVPPPPGSKQRLTQLGPEGFARWMRESGSLGVTDTTFRDAHQSLLATRIRTTGLLKVAPYIARTMPQLLSVECWAGRPTMWRCGF
ncbi:pyruvate carboxylase domain protein [Mycobacterium xenopi 3993]|nr:pyruvate carboxylase domain protein [Mycobacterium xenopi 3993]